MQLESLNIKHFSDYRDYLRSYIELKKGTNQHFSLGLFAKRLGLNSTSSLTKILNGEREPGKSIQDKFVEYFKFSKSECDYFEDLIRLAKLRDDVRLKALLMEKMGREHPDANLHILDDRSNEVISHWFVLAIREMVNLKDFTPNPEWIQKRLLFPVSLQEIQWAIDLLLHQGLILKNNDSYKVSSGLLHTTNDKSSVAIRSYHKQMLDNAKSSLELVPVEFREITAETLTINADQIPVAKELIRTFKSKFLRLLEEKNGNQTYQLQLQFFPLTRGSDHETIH